MQNLEEMTPEQIKAELSILQSRRNELDARIYGLRLRLAIYDCPFQVGETLVNRGGERARIDGIGPSQHRRASYSMRGVYLKKDGTPAMNPGRDNTRPRHCEFYEWDEWRRP